MGSFARRKFVGTHQRWRRKVRHKALQVAQKRVQTVMNRLTPGNGVAMGAELAAAIDRAGL